MAGLFAICLSFLWTSAHALNPELYLQSSDDQLFCTEISHETGVCKSVRYDIKHLSCIVKKSTSEPLTRILNFKKVSMCVPVCDEPCDGLTTISSVNFCRQTRPQVASNISDVHQSDIILSTTKSTPHENLHHDHTSSTVSLHQACEYGRLCMVQFILSQRPAEINTRDELGRTPVMATVMKNQVTVFDFLGSQSCDLMAVDNNSDTVLHLACEIGNVDIVTKLVVNHTCDIESRGRKGMTPVMQSALHGHRDVVEFLVGEGCNVTTLDDNMNNILHVACSGGHVDMVKYVLRELNLDRESRGEKGKTPIMIAAYSGRIGVLDFLVSDGCNQLAIDDSKDNIIHVACIGGHVEMVQHILKKTYINIEAKAKYGRTPVMRAAQYGQRSVVDFLVSNQCNLSAVDDHRNTLLHVACIGGHLSMVKHIVLKMKMNHDNKPMMTDKNKCKLLHLACKGGHVNIVKYVVEKLKTGIDCTYSFIGRTPVMSAALGGHLNVVKYLVSNGCKLTLVNRQRQNVLHLACSSGHVDIVVFILSRKKSLTDSRDRHGWTSVITAARCGHLNVVKYLVDEGCKLTILSKHGRKLNVLHVACMNGHMDIVNYILSHTSVAIDSRALNGRTPVMTAAFNGHINIVKYLISKGCKVTLVNNDGQNVLHVACERNRVDIVKYILSHTSVAIDSRGLGGRTPVMTAACNGHINIVKYLVSKGCKLALVSNTGQTVLHIACEGGNVDTVKYILSHTSITIDSRGLNGQTPVMTAAFNRHLNIVKYLVSKGCKQTLVSNTGQTVLHIACEGGNVDTVKYILSHTSITIDSRGLNGQTPVMTAAFNRHLNVVKYLVGKGCKLANVDNKGRNVLEVACMHRRSDLVKYLISIRSWSKVC